MSGGVQRWFAPCLPMTWDSISCQPPFFQLPGDEDGNDITCYCLATAAGRPIALTLILSLRNYAAFCNNRNIPSQWLNCLRHETIRFPKNADGGNDSSLSQTLWLWTGNLCWQLRTPSSVGFISATILLLWWEFFRLRGTDTMNWSRKKWISEKQVSTFCT